VIDQLGHALAVWVVPVNAWTAALLACVVLLDRVLARRARASLRIALYAPIALRVLLPLSWSIPVAHVPGVAMFVPLEVVSASPATVASPLVPWHAALAVVYVAVAAVLALRAVWRRWMLARALASARTSAAVRAGWPVLCHRELGPMVVGLFAPRIVLPEAMIHSASQPALACVLKHEVAHLRRGDPWLSVALELMLVVFWPVVPLWAAALRVRHLMELACDEAALDGADGAERRRYGHVLIDVAEQGSLAFAGAGSLHFGSRLRARIEAIALFRPWPRAVQACSIAAAVVGFAACSSVGPSTMQEAPGSTQTAGSAATDEYGYRFENDPLRTHQGQATAQDAQPASEENSNNAGRLAPEVIQQVVRQNFGLFRRCYEDGLQRDAKLKGTVTVSFVINPDGAVRGATDDGSTLPDASVVQCVVGGFSRLSYPAPQGGYVTVVYPVAFDPGD
jgi:beta-lactamase regulating signal transducer with metallopeptidase domain